MPSSQHRKERRNNHLVVDFYTDENAAVYEVDCEICQSLGQAIGPGGVIRKVDTLTPHYRVQTPLEKILQELHDNISWSDDSDPEGNEESEEQIRDLIRRAYAEGVKQGSINATDAGRKEMHTH